MAFFAFSISLPFTPLQPSFQCPHLTLATQRLLHFKDYFYLQLSFKRKTLYLLVLDPFLRKIKDFRDN